MVTWCLTFALLWCTRAVWWRGRRHKFLNTSLPCVVFLKQAENASVISNVNDHGRLKLLIFRILVLCSRFWDKGGGGGSLSPSWPWASCVSCFSCMLETRLRAQICHVIQEQHWKLEVRRLLQWPSNGWIMQLQSSGCPHYLAGVVMNGLKCMLSKSQEKCDPSSEIQMVPLQLRSTSRYVLFITRLMIILMPTSISLVLH